MKDDIWYAWKCITLVKANGTTVDLTIADDTSIISFLHYFYSKIYKPATGDNFLQQFKIRKIKMKLRFEA